MLYYNLTELNLSSFNTNNVKNMTKMFFSCYKITEINLSSFNTNNVIDMYGMFESCKNLNELNLSSFQIYKNNRDLFHDCSKLKKIFINKINIKNIKNDNNISY